MLVAVRLFLSTVAERELGPERLGIFQGGVVGVLVLYGLRLLAQFIGLLRGKI